MDELNFIILFLIIILSSFQTIAGVGILVLGTPILILFALFNLTPMIPTKYNIEEGANFMNLPESRLCPLNYGLCINTMVEDNFPNFLQGTIFILFIFPILLPVLFTILIYIKIIKKYS